MPIDCLYRLAPTPSRFRILGRLRGLSRSPGLCSLLVAQGLWLGACDQSSPATEGDAATPETGEIDESKLAAITTAEHTYPLVPNSSWVYAHRGGSSPWEEEVRLSEQTIDGKKVLLLSDTPGPSGSRSESVLSIDDHVAYRVSKKVYVGDTLQYRSEYDPGFARHDLRWLLRDKGYTETRDYGRKEWDGDGTLTRDGERAHSFMVEEVNVSVSVPAGVFDGCFVIHRMRERGMDDPSESDNKRYWYCPGVGKVKELEDDTGKLEELVSCDIPGGACP